MGQGLGPKQARGCLYRTTSIQICPQTKILHTNSTSNTSTTQTYSQDRTHKEKPISQLYYCNEHNHCHYHQRFDQLHFTPKPSQTSSKKVTWAIEMCVCTHFFFFFLIFDFGICFGLDLIWIFDIWELCGLLGLMIKCIGFVWVLHWAFNWLLFIFLCLFGIKLGDLVEEERDIIWENFNFF